MLSILSELLEKSTPEAPMWNIEKIKQGLKSKWNYIDGCMIKAVLQMYAISKDEKYLKFADDFIDYRVFEDGTIDGYNVGAEKYSIMLMPVRHFLNLMTSQEKKSTEKQLTLFIRR